MAADEVVGGYRFYGELAEWWPLISPPEGYVEEAAFAGELLASASVPVRTVLELGSGGGSNAVHLTSRFTFTLVDLSGDMLEVSRRLNPTCEHVVGDMRTVRLGRQFDAVFLHDAVDYMTTEDDLGAAIETAFIHCRPGGAAVFIPDHVVGKFEPGDDLDGNDGADGRAVRFLEWSWDPDPTDTWVQTVYVFALRVDGDVRVVQETHRTGLFRVEDWLRLLTAAGFRPEVVMEETSEERTPRTCFVAHRPR